MSKELTKEERIQELSEKEQIGRELAAKLTLNEMKLLLKAVKNPLIKMLAFKELKDRFKQ